MEEATTGSIVENAVQSEFQTMEYAPPAAPYEASEEQGESVKESIERMFLSLTNPENYQNVFQSCQEQARSILGEERYEIAAYYALPCIIALVWTLFIYILAYYRGRASKESVLEGEMMKTQAKLFNLEKDITKYLKGIKSATRRRSAWNFRMWMVLLFVEVAMGLYFYFLHKASYFPSVPSKLQYAPLVLIPIIILLLKNTVSFVFSSLINRREKNIKKRFESYDDLRSKYKRLMEENNHGQVMQCIHNIDNIEKSFKQKSRQSGPSKTPSAAPSTSSANHKTQPRPQPIPSMTPNRNTPMMRPNQAPNNGNTAPPIYRKQAPPLEASPYVPPSSKDGHSGGFFGTAMGLISGSTEVEELVCDSCGEMNGTQPKNEIKQFKCRKCNKFNGIKPAHHNSREAVRPPEKKREPAEDPDDDDIESKKTQ